MVILYQFLKFGNSNTSLAEIFEHEVLVKSSSYYPKGCAQILAPHKSTFVKHTS